MSLVPVSQQTIMTGLQESLFDQFCKELVIIKAPSVTSTNNGGYIPGYNLQGQQDLTYTQESGIFSGVRVPNTLDGRVNEVTEKSVGIEEITIKVRKPARDYILDGRPVEKIIFHGNTYNIKSAEGPRFFLTLTYYLFKLEVTT